MTKFLGRASVLVLAALAMAATPQTAFAQKKDDKPAPLKFSAQGHAGRVAAPRKALYKFAAGRPSSSG